MGINMTMGTLTGMSLSLHRSPPPVRLGFSSEEWAVLSNDTSFPGGGRVSLKELRRDARDPYFDDWGSEHARLRDGSIEWLVGKEQLLAFLETVRLSILLCGANATWLRFVEMCSNLDSPRESRFAVKVLDNEGNWVTTPT